ncbi:hypothetical protein M885DRAFT_546881 [Pelagophyceae sp. CCMP2097]|nr:hypothetical protein M885DRAFT_546881 [Pelagophyceae sp. CCMP2097]|mmetsp:Transcript_4546/g.16150  ORF Transcript_4546/g.16150 Transcript_4546/m.16150 type:complete len:380 (-) Transcript_4546:192-1331(-)
MAQVNGEASQVVVVGGGTSGLFCAKFLAAKGVSVTLVSPRDYWDYSISSPRCAVSPEETVAKKFTPPMAKICDFLKCTFVQGTVTEVSETGVTLDTGVVLAASYVIVAIGGAYADEAVWKARPGETTAAARLAGFEAVARDIAAAEHIVVSGAGLVGCEVAGEVKAKFPTKVVTLVGAMSGMSAKLERKTEKALVKLGVALVAGRTVGHAGGFAQLKDAAAAPLQCDVLLNCAGFTYDAASVTANYAGAVTAKGQVQTEPSLLIKGSKTVFAAGDIIEVPAGCFAPTSGFGKCEAHAKVVSANISAALAQKPLPKAHAWKTKPDLTPCVTALGPKVGVGDMGMPGCMGGVEDLVARKFKCDSFFLGPKMGALFGMGKTW